MKAEELMIDDWVMYHNELLHKSYPTRVEDGEHIDYIASNANFRPIPLTPEILEKNEFGRMPNAGYVLDFYNGTQVIYDSWNKNLRILNDYKTCLDIVSYNDMNVHELQHALRLCGINKDIVL